MSLKREGANRRQDRENCRLITDGGMVTEKKRKFGERNPAYLLTTERRYSGGKHSGESIGHHRVCRCTANLPWVRHPLISTMVISAHCKGDSEKNSGSGCYAISWVGDGGLFLRCTDIKK